MGQAKYVKNKPLYMPGTLYTNKEGESLPQYSLSTVYDMSLIYPRF